MAETERRRTKRQGETFPVSLVTHAEVELEGQTINVSQEGVLLWTSGRIDVRLGIKGKQYSRQLVRAYPVDDQTTEYAIVLDKLIEEPDTLLRRRFSEVP